MLALEIRAVRKLCSPRAVLSADAVDVRVLFLKAFPVRGVVSSSDPCIGPDVRQHSQFPPFASQPRRFPPLGKNLLCETKERKVKEKSGENKKKETEAH